MQQTNRRFFRFMAVIVVLSLSVIACRYLPFSSRLKKTTTPTITENPLVQPTDEEIPLLNYPLEDLVSIYATSYVEDFSDTPDDWDIHDFKNTGSEHKYSLKDGTLLWEIIGYDHTLDWFMPYVDLNLPQGDFCLEATLKLESDENPYGAGFIFRQEDYENYYFVGVDKTGAVEAGGFFNSEWETLIRPTRARSFVRGEMNRLAVFEYESTYQIYVNGSLVSWFHDERNKNGVWGMGVDILKGDHLLVTLDEVKLMQPKVSNAPDTNYQNTTRTPVQKTVTPTPTKDLLTTPIPTFPPDSLPTMMSMGASWSALDGDFKNHKFSISYPFAFKVVDSAEKPTICLDAPEKLCLSIQASEGNWADAQAFEGETIEKYRYITKYYQEISSQPFQTEAGLAGYQVNYYSNLAGRRYESTRLFLVVDGVGYDLTVDGELKVMQVYRETIQKMLASFTVN